jgi:hypothetical protein
VIRSDGGVGVESQQISDRRSDDAHGSCNGASRFGKVSLRLLGGPDLKSASVTLNSLSRSKIVAHTQESPTELEAFRMILRSGGNESRDENPVIVHTCTT